MGASKKKTCGVETADGTSCKRLINRDEEGCFIHDEGGTPEGIGAPEGNDNAEGNDGGAPHGNTNAARHGAHMTLDRRLEYINERGYLDVYLSALKEYQDQDQDQNQDKGDDEDLDDTRARRLAAVHTVSLMVSEVLFEDGLFREVPWRDGNGETVTNPETGEPYTEKTTHPAVETYLQTLRECRRLRYR
jgi:hypothetical protein